MLEENLFEDAFILHEESRRRFKMNTFFKTSSKQSKEDSEVEVELKRNGSIIAQDKRDYLMDKWASLTNIYKFQPLHLIRNYFGEEIALYFAFSGTINVCLFIISLIGIVFFGFGLKITLDQLLNTADSNNSTTNLTTISNK